MLTPKEEKEFRMLQEKRSIYISISEKELADIEKYTNQAARQISKEVLMASEPWNRLCSIWSTICQHNSKLLREVEYLKTLLKEKKWKE